MQIPILTRRVAVAAGAVLILGGSAVGIAAAQTAPSSTPTSQQNGYQKFIDALAQKLGVSSQALQQDIAQVRQDQGLPADGGFPREPRGPHGFGFGGPALIRQALDVAAQAIGISAQQLRSELPGKSLAQVAEAHGKTAADVATALKNAAHTRIDQAASANRLNGRDPNTLKSEADQRIDQLVNQVMPQRGVGRGAFGFGGPGLIRQGLEVAAQAIGISSQQLASELPGKSLAQVAEAHGKTAADVATALKNAAHSRIDEAAANNRLNGQDPNTLKSQADARIDQLVNQVMPQHRFPGRPARGAEEPTAEGA